MDDVYAPTSDFLNCVRIGEVTFEGEFGAKNLERLLSYADDPDDSNRDWAALFISELFNDKFLQDARLKKALLKLADDRNFDTRSEAILGLAEARTPEALDLVKSLLGEKSVGQLGIEAAGYLAHKSLLPQLYELQEWWDVDDDLLKRAIKACELGENQL